MLISEYILMISEKKILVDTAWNYVVGFNCIRLELS